MQTINFVNPHFTPVMTKTFQQSAVAPDSATTSDALSQLPTVRANQLAGKGLTFRGRSLNNLYDEYNWYINNDRETPINAFLKIEADPKTMDSFLTAILNTDDRSYEFIDSVAKSGKKLSEISEKLKNKIGEDSDNVKTFMPNSPYKKAYEKYLHSRYNNARTISQLLKIRPDWEEKALLTKSEQLDGHLDLTLGKVPKQIYGGKESYDKIVAHLTPFLQYGFKTREKIPDLDTGLQTLSFENYLDGHSDKNVFGMTTSDGAKFVIKMGEPKDHGLNRPFGLGTLALIDRYLTVNNCKNSAPLKYYDYKNNVSIYSYIDHCPISNPQKESLTDVNRHLSDFGRLGMYYNDNVGENNYFKLDNIHRDSIVDDDPRRSDMQGDIDSGIRNDDWISVDNDHVTFSSYLHPRVQGLNKSLPNQMGFCC